MSVSASFRFKVGSLQNSIEEELDRWQKKNKLQRLLAGDASLWTNSDENQWLGWLKVAEEEQKEVPTIEALAAKIKMDGYQYIVVLGMGGSSLCPAMLAETFGKIENNPLLQVLDSTDPMQIHHLEKRIDLEKTLFIVSSKSGSTLEPNIFLQYFQARLQTILKKQDVGDRFIAITDPGTKLEKIAKDEHFRVIFYGVPSIGGRYSALSNFGMVPAGLMGINVKEFLQYAQKMEQSCISSHPIKNNPGVVLGVILGVCANLGKDKITFITSKGIHALGAWLEQLLAESTGKQGKGLIPIDNEPLADPDKYGDDRVFIYIRLENDHDDKQDKAIDALEQSGQVVVRLNLPNKEQLGNELFRFEMATAVAGSIIGINPFNQPDVEGSKELAAKLISEYEKTGNMKKPKLLFSEGGIELFTDDRNTQEIEEHFSGMSGNPSLVAYIRSHLNRVQPGDYVNISAFIEMSKEHIEILQRCRVLIRDEKKVATCVGFGPRFLHSTGQDYKGGPNTGVFLQITAEHNKDIPIPNRNYSFGLVIDAQAEADFEVLAERKRRVIRIHLGKETTTELKKFCQDLEKAMKPIGNK